MQVAPFLMIDAIHTHKHNSIIKTIVPLMPKLNAFYDSFIYFV